MKIPIYQLDAFSERPFGGNPAAICPLDDWIPDTLMQSIAAENNLSETAYLVKREDGVYGLRWFTPTTEVDLCGHATLAASSLLFDHLGFDGDQVHFETRSGRLTVRPKGSGFEMEFPTQHATACDISPALTRALGAQPVSALQGVDIVAIFDREADVAALTPDFRAMAALGGRGVLATAPGDQVDYVARCFFPTYGIDEDPVTGSAHCMLAPIWAPRLNKKTLDARQISCRGGALQCEVRGEQVVLRGTARLFLRGEIQLEP